MRSYAEELRQLWFLDWDISQEDKIYFPSGWFNGLIEADLKTGEGKIISSFPGEIGVVGDLIYDVLRVENKLYFCPRSTNKLYVYDFEKKKMLTYDFPKNEAYWEERECKFGKLVYRDRYVFIMPVNYNRILRFDLDKEEFLVIDNWFKKFKELSGYIPKKEKWKSFFQNHITYNDKILWQVMNTEHFCCFDMLTNDTSYVKFDGGLIVSVEKSDVDTIFVCEDGRCWRYNVFKSDFEVITTIAMDLSDIFNLFVRVDHTCYFASISNNELISYDIITKKKEIIKIKTDGNYYDNSIGEKWNRQLLAIKKKDKCIYMQNKHNEIVIFNTLTKEYKTKRLLLDSYESINWEMNLEVDEFSKKYSFFPYTSSNLEILIYRLKMMKKMGKNEEFDSYGGAIYKKIFEVGR
ncbi:MAG: hypothetical protein IKJ73_07250 [Lachnospiraceae bacterium]|nr:hypothetical protein [Lachnospiraceae bacterium]